MSAFMLLILCTLASEAFAQPANNDCKNASEIVIGNGGFALGSFTSAQSDLSSATLQSGESFAPSIVVSGLNKKSVWYKFSLPTTRAVRVSLAQPGSAIQAGNVGFTVYKTTTCLAANADISQKLTPIETFGSTFNPCVGDGDYLIQVSSNTSANGPVYISLTVSDTTNAAHDQPKQAMKFGKVSVNRTTAIDYNVECQSIDAAAENCLPNGSFKNYTKSTWHTFTTPDYFDHFTVFLGIMPGNYNTAKTVFGYRIYEGDGSTTAPGSLTQIGGCDSLVTDLYAIARKMYKCGELKTNKTYTLQILYHKDFVNTMRMALSWDGAGATKGHTPVTSLAATNKLGTLKASANGDYTYGTDILGCNSRHSEKSCPNSMPANGVVYQGYRYNLSTFYSFTLASTTTLYINAYMNYCSPGLLVRLYKQSLTANCNDLDTANIRAVFYNSNTLSCLDPGNYVLQIMGSDTPRNANNLHISSLYTSGSYPACQFSNLGGDVNLNIHAKSVNGTNKFSLSASGKVDRINVSAGNMQPLKKNTLYNGITDTVGCAQTVLPDAPACNYSNDTSTIVYREFVVSDSMNLIFGYSGIPYSRLFKGDANSLATAQNKFSFPQRITGLEPWSNCMWYGSDGQQACVVPGTYTYATYTGPRMLGNQVPFSVTAKQTITRHFTPETAQNLGSLWDSASKYNTLYFYTDVDTFSCRDNGSIMEKLKPCGTNYSKYIFRQFYLKEASLISIGLGNGYTNYNGTLTMFRGKISDGVNTLTAMGSPWNCFSYAGISDQCNPLPAGWYTVVASANGPSYEKPIQDGGSQYSVVGQPNQFSISLSKACPPPQFNRPHKASLDTNTKKPYLIEWGAQAGSTAAYPVTHKLYTLNRTDFNCIPDTPFSKHPIAACAADLRHVSYYVFTTTQESFLQIDTKGYWGTVFAFDVRKDSVKMTSEGALQGCLNKQGQIQICKLQPGTYTLAIFSDTKSYCHSVTPTIYIDQVGYSRFDHASKAYDFGNIRTDSTWQKGKAGDVNPINNGRAPSNDFFYCTTGAQEKDPSNAACYVKYNPRIYSAGDNIILHPDNTKSPESWEIDRRNLWYTFTITKPGTVKVKVINKTSGKYLQYPFAVYKSDVDGSKPFTQVISDGDVDSTLLQGLTYISNNNFWYYCQGNQEISIYNEPCDFKPTRYYVLVENRNPYGYGDFQSMLPNSQVEVEILLDTATTLPTKFDHYFQANDLGEVNSGKKRGVTDNFSCATGDLTDPTVWYTSCQKTLWYKFSTKTTGNVRFRLQMANQNLYGEYYMQLFRETIKGDSTSKGLQIQLVTSYHYDPATGYNWGQRCVTPGTYYILLTGCSAKDEDVYPEIEVVEQAGDFCTRPVTSSLNGPGSRVITATVDCHTIGTDYGEFNPTLTCPAGAIKTNYKSSWYRIDVGGKDTLDVTVFINEKTNAGSSEIKYRMMTGNCGAMQEQSCVQDALTKNTYKCLAPGTSYYIQVFTPVISTNNQYVTGDIDLNISAVKYADTCLPGNPCIAVANFNTEFDCTKDKAVQFINFSTYGTSIQYEWDFGYNNQKSNDVSPRFVYPASTTNKNYTVTLVVTNTTCGRKDTVKQSIAIPARPVADVGRDTLICTYGASIKLDATSFDGATYYWSNGQTTPTATFTYSGNHFVEVKYKNCVARDTVNVYILPIQKKSLQTLALCKVDEVTLSSYRGQGEKYKWNTGSTDYQIKASLPGYYYADIYLNGCTIRDSFLVVSTSLQPLGSDTTICQKTMPFKMNATVSGASSYSWQDNSTQTTFTATKPGTYWVNISLSGCTFSDTITIKVDSFKTNTVKANICGGEFYTLPSGIKVNTPGTYKDTLRNKNGCDSLITTLNLTVTEKITRNATIGLCAGQTYTLPSGFVVSMAGEYRDTVRSVNGCDSLITMAKVSLANLKKDSLVIQICEGSSYTLPSGKIVNKAGIYSDTIRYTGGCDSLITAVSLNIYHAVPKTINASVCTGKSYQLPSGTWVSTAGTYRDTLKSVVNGCDSLRFTINLSLIPPAKRTATAYICSGSSYTLPSGKVVSSAGTYTDTARTDNGCDSLISTITLNVDVPTFNTVITAVCEGTGFTMPSGLIADRAGTYRDTLKNIRGCDSLITTLTLSLTTVKQSTVTAEICAGATFQLPSGKLIRNEGQYKDTLRYRSGCDSVIYSVELSVFNPVRVTSTPTICSGKTYQLPGGKTVSTAGTYIDTLYSAKGCDSVITTTQLKVLPPQNKTITTSICFGQTYTMPSGKIVSTAGNYSDTVRTSAGCDSLISTITLVVETASRITLNESICVGSYYVMPAGKEISAAGTYTDTLKNIRGCDSLITTVRLRLKTTTTSSAAATLCTGQTYTLPSGEIIQVSGTYKDTLVNSQGCDSIITTVISVNPELKAAINGTLMICEGETVTLNAVASGGKGSGYLYSWSAGNSTTNAVTLTPSVTTPVILTVSDGCTVNPAKDTVVVTVVPKPQAKFAVSSESGCTPHTVSFSNQSVAVNGSSYHWIFSNAAGDTSNSWSPSFTYSKAGVYTVTLTVTTPGGCTATYSDGITIINKPEISISGPAEICAGAEAGFTGNATGSDVKNWIWNFGNGNTSAEQNPPAQNFSAPGKYTIQLIGIADAACPDTAAFILTVHSQPVITLARKEASICRGGSVQLAASGGAKFQWSPATGLNNANIPNPLASPVTDTRYVVKVTSDYGCVSYDSVLVKVSQPFTISVSEPDSICAGQSVQLNVSGAVKYQWSPASGLSSVTIPDPVARPATTTTYMVVGFGNDNCFTDTAQVTVTVVPLPQVTAGRDTIVPVGSVFPLQPVVSNDVTTYAWTPSDYLGCTDCPIPVTSPKSEVTYFLTVKNSFGCTATDDVKISLLCSDADVFLPNTFTPNGDGANDIFYPRGKGIKTVKYLRIFNRWGEMVFEKKDFRIDDRSAGWDGVFKGQKLASGVFVYTAQMVCDNDQVIEKKGSVMIVR